MLNSQSQICQRASSVAIVLMFSVAAQALNAQDIDVTMDNYVVAESDWYFNNQQANAPINTFVHNGPVSKDAQDVIRSNRDVMYSLAVVTFPKALR